MTETRTTRTPVWRALLDGDCKQVHKTEKQLWHELKNRNAWYEPKEHNRWTAIVSDEDVPVVKGQPHDWSAEGGCGGVHVHYVCPHCVKPPPMYDVGHRSRQAVSTAEEYCDEDSNDQSPYLWFCERGKGLILVETD